MNAEQGSGARMLSLFCLPAATPAARQAFDQAGQPAGDFLELGLPLDVLGVSQNASAG
jgi:hypothetical protein